jgi:hypothetical protein
MKEGDKATGSNQKIYCPPGVLVKGNGLSLTLGGEGI